MACSDYRVHMIVARQEISLQRETLVVLLATTEYKQQCRSIDDSGKAMANLKTTCAALAYHDERQQGARQEESFSRGPTVPGRVHVMIMNYVGRNKATGHRTIKTGGG